MKQAHSKNSKNTFSARSSDARKRSRTLKQLSCLHFVASFIWITRHSPWIVNYHILRGFIMDRDLSPKHKNSHGQSSTTLELTLSCLTIIPSKRKVVAFPGGGYRSLGRNQRIATFTPTHPFASINSDRSMDNSRVFRTNSFSQFSRLAGVSYDHSKGMLELDWEWGNTFYRLFHPSVFVIRKFYQKTWTSGPTQHKILHRWKRYFAFT
jgi:hypothetical protein